MSMDYSEVDRIVKEWLPKYQTLFSLNDWKITYTLGETTTFGEVVAASININSPYNSAAMVIDPARAKGADDVRDSIRHELFHVLMAPFDVYRNIITIDENEPNMRGATQDLRERATWKYCIEQTIVRLERTWLNLMISMRFGKIDLDVELGAPDPAEVIAAPAPSPASDPGTPPDLK